MNCYIFGYEEDSHSLASPCCNFFFLFFILGWFAFSVCHCLDICWGYTFEPRLSVLDRESTSCSKLINLAASDRLCWLCLYHRMNLAKWFSSFMTTIWFPVYSTLRILVVISNWFISIWALYLIWTCCFLSSMSL